MPGQLPRNNVATEATITDECEQFFLKSNEIGQVAPSAYVCYGTYANKE